MNDVYRNTMYAEGNSKAPHHDHVFVLASAAAPWTEVCAKCTICLHFGYELAFFIFSQSQLRWIEDTTQWTKWSREWDALEQGSIKFIKPSTGEQCSQQTFTNSPQNEKKICFHSKLCGIRCWRKVVVEVFAVVRAEWPIISVNTQSRCNRLSLLSGLKSITECRKCKV